MKEKSSRTRGTMHPGGGYPSSSPLSPSRTTPSHSASLRAPQSQISRQHQAKRQRELHLSSLPRFHPAVYCAPGNSDSSGSPSSEMLASPYSSYESPRPPLSPRTVKRQFSEAQAKLWQYTRDAQGAAWGRATSPHRHRRQPSSPGVPSPLGRRDGQRSASGTSGRHSSPGSPEVEPVNASPSVTPLALEVSNADIEYDESGGYLVAGVVRSGTAAELSAEERENLVDALIERESDGKRTKQ